MTVSTSPPATGYLAAEYPTEQDDVTATLHAIMAAVRDKDFARLVDYHLDSPKFTKFDDLEPLDRQDSATANRLEAEALGTVEDFTYDLRDLKVDVFGHTAIATFVFAYGFTADGAHTDLVARATMVFVRDEQQWKIAHEHFSPYQPNG